MSYILIFESLILTFYICRVLDAVACKISKGRGTLEFTVDVDVPKKLTDEQREILTQFAKSFGEEVNPKKRGIFGR